MAEAPPARVVFETDQFRILDMNVPPATALEHASAGDVASISMSEGAGLRIDSASAGGDDAPRPIGGVHIGTTPNTFRVENGGDGPHQLFAIERIQSGEASDGEPLSGRGTSVAAESQGMRAYDVRLGEETFQVSHVHAVPAIAVLVQGRIISQSAELESGPNSEAPTGVKQLDQPGQWVFVPPGEAHYVVRLGPDPVHVVEVEIR